MKLIIFHKRRDYLSLCVAMAEAQAVHLLLPFLLFLLHLYPCIPSAITPETCSSSDLPCQAFVDYVPINNIRLSDVANRLFSVNSTSILSSSDFNLSSPALVLPANKPLRIPLTCGCFNQTRTITSVNYTVISGDTLSIIADQYYSRLITYPQIAAANGIPNPNIILAGQIFMIPIPCACRNGTDNGFAAEFLSYQVQTGDTLSSIASNYGTTVADLQQINGNATSLQAFSDIVFVPLRVCKANFSKNALDHNLTVAEGSYAITANNCVQCSCDNGTLHCSPTPSSIGSSCSSRTCSGSKLELGAYNTSTGSRGCTVESCVYKGYTSTRIMSSLETAVDRTCPAPPPPPELYNAPPDLAAAPFGQPVSVSGGTTPPPSPATTPPTTPPSNTSPRACISSLWPLPLVLGLWLPFAIHGQAL